MTDKELRRLKRSDLLELLIAQTERNETLQAQLDSAQGQLQRRDITIQKAGSIAEASLQLNGVFAAAEKAGRQYLDNIARLSGEQEKVCAQMEAQMRKKCEAMERDSAAHCKAMIDAAKTEADNYWANVRARVEQLCQAQTELQGLLQMKNRQES